MARPTGYISPPHCIRHDTGPGHPEQPARLDVINAYMEQTGLAADLVAIEARHATAEELAQAHDAAHVSHVIGQLERGVASLDPDTVVSQESLEAAYLAAGAALAGVDAIYDESDLTQVFCGVRPPGHHAESRRAMGFCVFNNVAVAAMYARAKGLAERVLILDWDVHHGNGTQQIFNQSADVFYYSIHQYPHYPGTGAASERGAGAGRGFTLNRPLATGADDDTYFRVLETDLNHIADTFKPDLVMISAGFDAHRDDPLGGMRVTTEGFGRLTKMVQDLALQTAGGRLLSVLEGGYNLDALRVSVARHLRVLLD